MGDRNKDDFLGNSSSLITTIITLVIVVLSVLTNSLFQYVSWWALVINTTIVILGLFVISLIRNNTNNYEHKAYSILDNIEVSARTIGTITEELKTVSSTIKASTDVYDYVYGSAMLRELEGSVGENKDVKHPFIYVRSTRFFLETTDDAFGKMLINNLRKGVRYYYLIPSYNIPDMYDSFNSMVLDWWEKYSVFLRSKKECEEVYAQKTEKWDGKYLEYLHKAKSFWNRKDQQPDWYELIQNVFELFKRRLKVYTAEECTFYTVTALYQVGLNAWKAIEKLPTDYLGSNVSDYYSFVIFGKEAAGDDNTFVKRFRDNFKICVNYDINVLYLRIEQYNRDELYVKHGIG